MPTFRNQRGRRVLPSGGTPLVSLQPTPRLAGPISSLLRSSCILLNLRSADRLSAISEVAQTLKADPDLSNFDGFYADLIAREELDSTCIGHEVALPHARSEHVKRMVLAVGRSEGGIFFEKDRQTVKLFFVLGTPADQPLDYLLVIRDLCKALKEGANRENLLKAATPEAFIAAWNKATENH